MSILGITVLILFMQAPEAAIEGVVVRAGTSEPLSKATVELRRAEGNGTHSYVTTTGSDGRFFLRNVQPGQYRLVATRDAYVRAEYGQRGPNAAGSPITVTAGQQMRNVQMAMTPTGTIYGRVYDRAGRPAVNATVQALRSSYQGGRRVPKLVQSTLTNDLGEYRLFWLAPGFYYINATPSTAGSNDQVPQPITNPDAPPDDLGGFVGGVMFGSRTGVLRPHEAARSPQDQYVPTYFPGTTDENTASTIDLRARASIGGIDITVAPVQAHRVRGVIVNSVTGRPQYAELMRLGSLNSSNRPSFEPVDPDNGTFNIFRIVPGRYLLVATVGKLTGRASIEVADQDLENVVIVAIPGFGIPGRIVIEGRPVTDSVVASLQVNLRTDFPIPDTVEPKGVPSVDGSFSLENVLLDTYRIDVTFPPTLQNAYLKSVRLGITEVLNAGLKIERQPEGQLEIVIGTNPGALEGKIVNAQQEAAINVTVTLVPDAARRHRAELYKTVQTDASGRFQLQGIPPGDYKVYAWENVEEGAWQDPNFMRLYEDRGKPVRINEGGRENLEATVIPAR